MSYNTTKLADMARNGRAQAAKNPGSVGALMLGDRAEIYEGAVAAIDDQAAEIARLTADKERVAVEMIQLAGRWDAERGSLITDIDTARAEAEQLRAKLRHADSASIEMAADGQTRSYRERCEAAEAEAERYRVALVAAATALGYADITRGSERGLLNLKAAARAAEAALAGEPEGGAE